jgi:3-dehydro-L-gulonate 2-dehydrogenase
LIKEAEGKLMLRVPYEELLETLNHILLRLGFSADRATLCARLFADSSRDGVYSHGVNRFPRFVRTIRNGIVDIQAQPELVTSLGALERWDGKSGPGNLNAYQSMERAISLSREHGMGCVALANTNHWMRGGTYGWQAAEAGAIGICWTNTMPNLPPWGGSEPRLGNNPLVVAVPRPEGHVVLDMAMSQFSYGALESYRRRGELLPVIGGFDGEGQLTRDPATIEQSARPLPIGYWKGSGLALVLDLMAGLLCGGRFTHQITPDPEQECGLSQVFGAFNLPALAGEDVTRGLADAVIEDMKSSSKPDGAQVRYPGEQVLRTRRENLARGIPIEREIWDEVRRS